MERVLIVGIVICLVMIVALCLLVLHVNDTWYIFCGKMNDDWAKTCQKCVDDLTEINREKPRLNQDLTEK